MFNPYEQQQKELDRRRQMAQFLIGQQFQQQPRENALTALSRVLGARFAGQSMQGVKSDQEALNTERQTASEAERKAISEALMGKPGVTPFSAETPGPMMHQPAIEPDKNKALALMLGAQDPDMRKVGMAQALKDDGFTLGAGQVRYGPGGQVIAQGPTEPSGKNTPSAVNEYKFYQTLSPEDQKTFMAIKRADPGVKVIDAGGKHIVIKSDSAETVAEFDKDVAPEKQPKNIRSQKVAEAQGEAEGAALAKADTKAADLQEAISLTDSLLTNESFDAAFGAVQGRFPDIRQGTIDVRAQVDKLVSMLSLENREKMKGTGQISDYESKLLGKSATILQDPLISDEAAREEVKRIQSIFIGKQKGTDEASGVVDWGSL